MRFIDPHIHMYSRTTDDYERMKLSGIQTVIEPSFWLGQERTSVETLEDYWDYIISFERQRGDMDGRILQGQNFKANHHPVLE